MMIYCMSYQLIMEKISMLLNNKKPTVETDNRITIKMGIITIRAQNSGSSGEERLYTIGEKNNSDYLELYKKDVRQLILALSQLVSEEDL